MSFKYNGGTNRWIPSSNNASTLASLAGVANRMDIFPVFIRRDMTVVSLGVLCSTAVASALGKIVIYSSNPTDHKPDALLRETATLDFGTTGFKSTTISALALTKGQLIWVGIRHSSTAAINTHQLYAAMSLDDGATPTSSVLKVLRRTLAFATAAPSTWGWVATEATSATPPAIYFRET